MEYSPAPASVRLHIETRPAERHHEAVWTSEQAAQHCERRCSGGRTARSHWPGLVGCPCVVHEEDVNACDLTYARCRADFAACFVDCLSQSSKRVSPSRASSLGTSVLSLTWIP